jgi:hypothetical protein
MIENTFQEVYQRFKLHFYEEIFKEIPDCEVALTATEALPANTAKCTYPMTLHTMRNSISPLVT